MKKISYLFISLILLINISACAGYKPIFSSSNFQFKIINYSIVGDKKLGNQIYSNLYNLSKSNENNANKQNEGKNSENICANCWKIPMTKIQKLL